MDATQTPYELGQIADATCDIQLVQLTDCHILRNPEDELKGLNTRDSFSRVLTSVREPTRSWDLLLATGDLSQDESAESYAYLAAQFTSLDCPIAWVPGNHDDPDVMGRSFQGENILNARQILLGKWQIILLDSSIRGEVHGRVSEVELEFMRHALESQPQRHALICLHHPAIPCGSAWLDQKSLLDAELFRNAVCHYDQVRAVLWGHVHQEAHFRRDNIDWMSTPSTCTQFKPDSFDFALDSLPPGYRSLSLKPDGRIESEVVWVG